MSTNNSVDLEDTQKDEEMVEDQTDDTGTDSSDGGNQNDTKTDAGEDWEARAKKAEAILARQTKKKDKPAEVQSQPTNSPVTVDPVLLAKEVRLLANLSDEEIAKLDVVAKGTGKSREEAMTDEMFISFQKDLKEKQRKEKAKLGASHGSGQANKEDDFNRPMSAEEHKAAWKKRYGVQ